VRRITAMGIGARLRPCAQASGEQRRQQSALWKTITL
jgi:hypothetical protein